MLSAASRASPARSPERPPAGHPLPYRPGGTRTPNRRFWRPVLYQLSYGPSFHTGPAYFAPDPHGQGRNRTADTTIFSRVLYQLSYLAKKTARAFEARAGSPGRDASSLPACSARPGRRAKPSVSQKLHRDFTRERGGLAVGAILRPRVKHVSSFPGTPLEPVSAPLAEPRNSSPLS
jgi:hypothetical protein